MTLRSPSRMTTADGAETSDSLSIGSDLLYYAEADIGGDYYDKENLREPCADYDERSENDKTEDIEKREYIRHEY